MNRNQQLFISALELAIHGKKPEDERFDQLSADDWNEIFRLARNHRVTPMIYDVLSGKFPSAPDGSFAAFASSLSRSVRGQIAAQVMATDEYLRLTDALRAQGLHPLAVKGIICRSLYPKPDNRPSSDEDLLIPEAEFDASRRIAAGCGLTTPGGSPGSDGKMTGDEFCVALRSPQRTLTVEMHRALFSPSGRIGRELNALLVPEELLSRAAECTVNGHGLLTLSPTDHLLYLICHALKHFLHSGFGLRQVCDIVLFAQKYDAEIDWDAVTAACRSLRANQFAAELFLIGRKWLKTEVPGVPAELLALETDEGPLLDDLLAAGVYGGADADRRHSSNITLNAVEKNRRGRGSQSSPSGLRALLGSLFPPAESLEWKYTYLRRNRWLLPWAWVSRISGYLWDKLRGRRRESAAGSLRIGRDRVNLLRKYGMIE